MTAMSLSSNYGNQSRLNFGKSSETVTRNIHSDLSLQSDGPSGSNIGKKTGITEVLYYRKQSFVITL